MKRITLTLAGLLVMFLLMSCEGSKSGTKSTMVSATGQLCLPGEECLTESYIKGGGSEK